MPKKCTVCKKPASEWDQVYSTTQKVCSFQCAIKQVESDKKKAWRKEKTERKEKLKSLSDWTKETQREFNRFIRARDKDAPCISCGRFDFEIKESFIGGKWDCGHYKTVGAFPELRFEELNAHKQCKSCNAGSGKYTRKNHTVSADYRENLIKKIGLEQVEWLEGPHKPKKYTIDDVKEIKAEYKLKLKGLKNIS